MKTKNVLKLLMLVLTLSSCSTSVTSYGYLKEHYKIAEEKLADGSSVKVGMAEPETSWNCVSNFAQKNYNWSWIKAKNMDYLPAAINTLKAKAIADANKEHLKPSYIRLDIPNEVDVGRLNATALSDATANYYKCTGNIPVSK
ncbi:MAG: hypothetical protein ACK5Z5_09140 [Neisseriaceae bacterium]